LIVQLYIDVGHYQTKTSESLRANRLLNMKVSLKQIIFLFCFTCTIFINDSKLNAQEVKWMTWEEAQEKSKVEQRKIFIDVYTDWCTWCKKLDETTLKDSNIANYLNESFYPVKLNAQRKEDITFQGRTYKYVENGINSYHELAYQLLNGQLKYPTIVFLEDNFDMIQSIPGFRTPFELELFMLYFAEDRHQDQPWYRFKSEQESLLLKRNQNSLLMPIGGVKRN